MITAHDVDRLRAWRSHEYPMVSLYLNVTPPRPFVSELNSLIHLQKERWATNNQLDKRQLRALEELLARIESHVRSLERQLERTRLLAIFASPDGFWQEYRLPVALPSQLVVNFDPYIRPLTVLLDEFDRYCVVVSDARKARIFSLYLGEFEEEEGFFEDNVPSKVSVGRGVRLGGRASGAERGNFTSSAISKTTPIGTSSGSPNAPLNFSPRSSVICSSSPDRKTRPSPTW
jgi:hypothetical protein